MSAWIRAMHSSFLVKERTPGIAAGIVVNTNRRFAFLRSIIVGCLQVQADLATSVTIYCDY